MTRPERRPGRGPFLWFALASLPLLGALGAASPGGDAWRWLDFPFGVAATAAALGIWAMRSHTLAPAFVVVVGTPILRTIWAVAHDYMAFLGVKGEHLVPQTEEYRLTGNVLWSDGVECLAPWAMGAAFGLLAALSMRRREELPVDVNGDLIRAAAC
jgi:hypothetical protein